MNKDANIKQFEMLKFINENNSDHHVVSTISIVLRRDKIEAPYYMDTKIKLSSCIDNSENGMIHSMDLLSHNRMHNLTEDAYNEIKSLLLDALDNSDESVRIKIFKEDERLKVVLKSINEEEFRNIFTNCQELFEKIDNLVD